MAKNWNKKQHEGRTEVPILAIPEGMVEHQDILDHRKKCNLCISKLFCWERAGIVKNLGKLAFAKPEKR